MTVGSRDTESWSLKSWSTRVACPSDMFGPPVLVAEQKTPPVSRQLEINIPLPADLIALTSSATEIVRLFEVFAELQSAVTRDSRVQSSRQRDVSKPLCRPLPLRFQHSATTHVVLMHDMASASLSRSGQSRRSPHKLKGRPPKSSVDSLEDSSRESSVTSSVSTPVRRPSRKQPASAPVVSLTSHILYLHVAHSDRKSPQRGKRAAD